MDSGQIMDSMTWLQIALGAGIVVLVLFSSILPRLGKKADEEKKRQLEHKAG